jgi:hypothetical protein
VEYFPNSPGRCSNLPGLHHLSVAELSERLVILTIPMLTKMPPLLFFSPHSIRYFFIFGAQIFAT